METANVVLVTGAGHGFGRSAALAFGRARFDVVCADRDVDLASKTAAEIEEAGGQAIPIQADATTHMDVLNAFHKVFEIFGDLAGVCHVASRASGTPFGELTEGEFAELLEDDLKSTYLVLKVARQVLRDAWTVLIGPPTGAREPHVAAVRGALRGLTASFAQGSPRVNLALPSRAASDARHDAALADAVLFLASNAARGVGGQTVEVRLPPPPRVSEAMLPEVRAALDADVRQDDLEADLYEDDDEGNERDEGGEADEGDERGGGGRDDASGDPSEGDVLLGAGGTADGSGRA